MKSNLANRRTFFLTILFIICTTLNVWPHTSRHSNFSEIDELIHTGLEYVKTAKWKEAEECFEEANKIFEKEKQPSDWLFTQFTLPDEDGTQPSSDRERQFIRFRHAMATKQALLQFLAFSYQLEGNSDQAEKYHDAVYGLQGPLWGTSWRIFAPRFCNVFAGFVKVENGENLGRYQYLSAMLMLDAGEEFKEVFELLKKAQQNSPKDVDIAAFLANGYLQNRDPKEAKRQAELSLSLKPDQASVLIDLSTAELLMDDLDNAIKHAEAAAKLDGSLPGPHVTLALAYIGKNQSSEALKEAAKAVELSRRHPFYLTVQAAVYESAGKAKEAEKLIGEAWEGQLPDYNDLDKWYISERLRAIVLKIVGRLKK